MFAAGRGGNFLGGGGLNFSPNVLLEPEWIVLGQNRPELIKTSQN